MKAYLLSLLAVAAIAAISGLLSGSERGDAGLRLVTGLCVLLVVVSPVATWIRSGGMPDFSHIFQEKDPEHEEYESIFEGSYTEYGGVYLAEQVSRLLSERYGKEASCFTVRIGFSEDGKHITEATVLLSGRAAFVNTYDLEAYVGELLGCSCKTAIG